MKNFLQVTACCAIVVSFAAPAQAQSDNYPARPIRVLAGGAAGGPMEVAKWAKVIKDSGARVD